MVDGNVSDASPPRRRTRHDDTAASAKRYRSSRLSQSRHLDPTSGFRTRENSVDRFTEDGADTPVKEDVSDASPPRQRRRVSHLSQESLTNNTVRTKNRSPRRSRPGPSTLPDETASMRSVEVSTHHHRTDHNYGGSLAAPASKRNVATARAPRNRFGIQPGPRWDGVNRSNGFEERLEAMQSMRKDVELEGYRASVADL